MRILRSAAVAAFLSLAAFLFLSVEPALALASTAHDVVWSWGVLLIWLQPYVVTILQQVVLPLFLAWLCLLLKAHYHVTVDAATQAKITSAIAGAAGRIMASHDASFATMKVDLGHSAIAAEVPVVTAALQKLAPKPAEVAQMIQGEVGRLQAQASSVRPS